MPCVKRERRGGMRNLFLGRKSQYTMRSSNREATFQVNVVVKYSKGKYNRNGLEYFAYAVYGIDIPSTSKNFNQKIRYKTPLCKIRLPTGEYLDLPPLDLLSVPRQGSRHPLTYPFKTKLKNKPK